MTTETPETTWFDDDGELTELTDSEDEAEPEIPPLPPVRPLLAPVGPPLNKTKSTRPSTQYATQKSRERKGLKTSTPSLKPPRTATYSASSLHEWVEQGLVDLDAEYQRGVIWKEEKQMNLIDSLFHNFYIPPIVFAVERHRDGSERRICIDGKQRLTSIHRFSKGEIAHKDSTTNRKSYFVNPPKSKKRSLISSQMQANFKNKQIACVEYDDLTPEQEREIFQRVQLGVSLAPADRLPAINGPYADLVRRLRNRIDTTTGFETYLEWGKVRGKDFQALAQILYIMVHGHQPRTAEPMTTRLEAFLAQGGDNIATLQEAVYNVMDIFCRIVGDPELGRPLHRNLSPLEMVMSGYLISLQRKKLSDTQLSDAIDYMRKDFNRTAPEPKFNRENFKHLLNFVLKEVPKLIPRLRRGTAGEKPASLAPYTRTEAPARSVKAVSGGSEPSAPSSFTASAKPVKTAAKRKRPTPSEKDDDESDSDCYVKKKRATRKPESNVNPVAEEHPSGNRISASMSTDQRVAPLKLSIGNKNTSTARTIIKTKARQVSTSALNTPPVSSASTANPKLGTQVGKPSVRPSSSARLGSVNTGAPMSNSMDIHTPQHSAPLLPSSTSMSTAVPQAVAPVTRPALPGRARLPGSFSSATQTSTLSEQDFRRPSASNGTAVPEAGLLYNSVVQVTRAEDMFLDAGGVHSAPSNTTRPASTFVTASSNRASLSSSSSTRHSKLPNIKFNKTHTSSEQLSTSSVNEDRWKADTDALLHSIGSSTQASRQPPLQSTSTPSLSAVRAPRMPQVAGQSSSGHRMVSQQVLAPQTASRPNPGGGVQTPGQPVTPMSTPSPTLPDFQPRALIAGVPSTASGFALTGNGRPMPTAPKTMSSSSCRGNGSSTNGLDPRLARMDAHAQLLAAHQARNASQTQAQTYPPSSAMPTPPTPSGPPAFLHHHLGHPNNDPSNCAPKRQRASREASLDMLFGSEDVDGDEQQHQQQGVKRGRSCRRQDS